jgi:hypothetical protein
MARAMADNSPPPNTNPLTPDQIKLLQQINANPKQRSAAMALLQQNGAPAPSPSNKPTKSKAATPAPQQDAIIALLAKNENKLAAQKQYSPCAGFNLLLRQNWADTGIIAGNECPDTVDKATGALVSFTDDQIAKNRTVLIDGTAALIYNSVTGDTPGQITPYETSFGVYTTVDNSMNSAAAAAKSNIDTLSYGGVLELGFVANDLGANYFRIRGDVVQDGVKGTQSGNIALEWLPVLQPYIHIPIIEPFGLPLILRFDPDLVALYDQASGKTATLAFNNQERSLRLGPQLTLNIFPFPGASDFWSRFKGTVSYDIHYETYSERSLHWFQSSLTFNIDEKGYIGLTGTYKRGQDETTGEQANVYTIGLSGKI